MDVTGGGEPDRALDVGPAQKEPRASRRPPLRQIRASYDDSTVTVYQAYSPAIAMPAVQHGRFVVPFSMSRMTWIKPSFLWMMYRCGWATKEGQTCVLAIRITRTGFEQALAASALSHLAVDVHTDRREWADSVRTSPVRVQWDPERDSAGSPLPWWSLQSGTWPRCSAELRRGVDRGYRGHHVRLHPVARARIAGCRRDCRPPAAGAPLPASRADCAPNRSHARLVRP